MRPWNPYSLTRTGEAIVGQIPVRYVVYGPPLTPQQSAFAQHAYAAFHSMARLSVVQNYSTSGSFPDGSRYTVDLVGRAATMVIWTQEKKRSVVAFGGVVRLIGNIYEDGKYLYKEFKENKSIGNDPPEYKNTAKLYDTNTIGRITDSVVWQTFARDNLSGPAGKLAQFGRGAVRAYTEYYKAKALPLVVRTVGFGVAIFKDPADPSKMKAYCYGDYVSGSAIRYVQMLIAPLTDFPGLEPPSEIISLFGGIPIPPTEAQWSSSSLRLTQDGQLMALIGASAGPYLAGRLSFPMYASAGRGADVHFVVTEADKAFPMQPSWAIYRSTLVRMQISLDPVSGGLVSSLTKVDSGISDINANEVYYPAGTHVAPTGVTHVNGVLTVFRRETFIRDDYKIGPPSIGAKTTKTISVKEMWSGGESGEVISYHIHTYETLSGYTSGQRVTRYDGSYTETVGEWTSTYSLWGTYIDAYIKEFTMIYKSWEGLGCLNAFGREGCFSVTRTATSQWNGNVLTTTGSLSIPGSKEYGHLIRTTNGTQTLTYPDLNPDDYFVDFSAVVVYAGDTSYEEIYTGTDFTGSHLLPSTTTTQTIKLQKTTHLGDTVYAGGTSFVVDSEAILRDFETDAQYASLKVEESGMGGIPFTHRSPMTWIRSETGTRQSYPVIAASQLGGKQAIFGFNAYSRRRGEQHNFNATKGTLVETPYDLAYDASKDVFFVGETQP